MRLEEIKNVRGVPIISHHVFCMKCVIKNVVSSYKKKKKKCSLFSTRTTRTWLARATDQFWKSHSNLKVKPAWICLKRRKDKSQYETFWLLTLDMISTHADVKTAATNLIVTKKNKKQKNFGFLKREGTWWHATFEK